MVEEYNRRRSELGTQDDIGQWVVAIDQVLNIRSIRKSKRDGLKLFREKLNQLKQGLAALSGTYGFDRAPKKRLPLVFGNSDSAADDLLTEFDRLNRIPGDTGLFNLWLGVYSATSDDPLNDLNFRNSLGLSVHEIARLDNLLTFPGARHGSDEPEAAALLALRKRYESIYELTRYAAPMLLWIGFVDADDLYGELLELCRAAVLEDVTKSRLLEQKLAELTDHLVLEADGKEFIYVRKRQESELRSQVAKVCGVNEASKLSDLEEALGAKPVRQRFFTINRFARGEHSFSLTPAADAADKLQAKVNQISRGF